MTAPRSRRERQAETRQRLLEVGSVEFLEHGYQGTSLERIAEAAGYSKGAVYSNFAGKEELVLAVLDAHFLHRLDDLQARVAAAPVNVQDRLVAFAGWWEDMIGEQQWGVLILEVASSTRDRPQFQAELAVREERIRSFCAVLITAEAERFDLPLPLSPQELADVLVSLGSGLSFSRMLDPSVTLTVLSDLARILFAGVADTRPVDGVS